MTLTIREAAEYNNIGINKIDSILRMPTCPFALFLGSKKLVKCKEFEDYIGQELIIWPIKKSGKIALEKEGGICYTHGVVVRSLSLRKGAESWERT